MNTTSITYSLCLNRYFLKNKYNLNYILLNLWPSWVDSWKYQITFPQSAVKVILTIKKVKRSCVHYKFEIKRAVVFWCVNIIIIVNNVKLIYASRQFHIIITKSKTWSITTKTNSRLFNKSILMDEHSERVSIILFSVSTRFNNATIVFFW